MGYSYSSKAQITRTACLQLFCPFSYWSFVSPKSTSCKLQLVYQNTPKWSCSGGTQLRTQVDLGSQSRTQFEEEALKSPQLSSAYWQWPSSCSWSLVTATSRFRHCNVAFSPCVSWHRLLVSVFLWMIRA